MRSSDPVDGDEIETLLRTSFPPSRTRDSRHPFVPSSPSASDCAPGGVYDEDRPRSRQALCYCSLSLR